MSLLILAFVNSIAALFAHEFAQRKSRNSGLWTLLTALFAPMLVVVLLLPDKADIVPAAAREGL